MILLYKVLINAYLVQILGLTWGLGTVLGPIIGGKWLLHAFWLT